MDGWTQELLESFLESGKVVKSAHWDRDEVWFRYYAYDIGSKVNASKLMESATGVRRAFDDYPNESDLEFVTRMLL